MKNLSIFFFSIFFITIFSSISFGQSAGDYRSAATGNWNNPSTWERFDGTSWVTAGAFPTNLDGIITIRSPYIVTITANITVNQVVIDSGAQITVNNGVTLSTNDGLGNEITVNGILLHSGIVADPMSGTGVIGSAGTYIHNTISSATRMVDFFGAGINSNSNWIYRGSSTLTPAVSISGKTYGNLSFESTSGSMSLLSNAGANTLTVNGNLSIGTAGTGSVAYSTSGFTGAINIFGNLGIGTSSTFTVNASTVSISGNWTNNGTFGSGSSSIIYLGSSNQTIGGASTTTFNNLTINNSAGVTLSQTTIISGTLTISSGVFDLGTSNNLTTGAVSVATNGTWKKYGSGTIILSGNVSNSGLISFNGNTASCNEADAVLIRSSSAGTQRFWSGSGIFVFVDTDVQDQAGSASITVQSGTNTSNNGSNWTFGTCGVTDIVFESGTASQYIKANNASGGTLVQWRTGMEVSSLGFHVYREEDGKLNRVSPNLIAGSALFAGANTLIRAGRSYAWRDPKPADPTTRYFVEEVDVNGKTQLYGPIYVDASQSIKEFSALDRADSLLVGEVNQSDTNDGETAQGAQLENLAQPAKLSREKIAAQAVINSQTTAKLAVKQEGWHRITGGELTAIGFTPNADPRFLQMFVDGQEIPIRVTGDKDGKFDATDAVEFYGLGLDSAFTNSRTYYLVANSQVGRRITEIGGGTDKSPQTSFSYTVERKDRTIYFSSLKNGEKENFFGAVLTPNPLAQFLSVKNLSTTATEDAVLEIALQGVTQIPHIIKVLLNDVEVYTMQFYGQENASDKIRIAHSLLREGQNTVTLIAQGGYVDISLVDFLRLSYNRAFVAENDALRFTTTSKDAVTIDGFSNKDIQVFDVTSQSGVQQIRGKIEQHGASYSVTINVPGNGAKTLIATTTTQYKKPTAALKVASDLRNANQEADYLIVTRKAFFESLKPLAALRQSQGLNVKVVDIESVYDEFSLGNKTPQALRDFLNYTRTRWKKAPKYFLLAADATFDPKNYLQRGDFDIVPTKLVDTDFMETATDDWFADFNNDGVADIATGRLPARTESELAGFVSKIIVYEQSLKTDSALLIADNNVGYNFEEEVSQLRNFIPLDIEVEEVYRGQLGDAIAKGRILDGLNRGQKLVTYAGHGSVDLWSGGLFSSADALNLTNGSKLPLFVMTSCLNGYFQDPSLESLGESLLKAPRGGAIAVWASSALTFPQEQQLMNQKFYQLLLTNRGRLPVPAITIGEAAMQAKATIQDSDIRRSWILLGDPALRLK